MASTPVPAPIPGDITASPPAWPYHPRDETASSPAPAPSGSAASSPMETVPTSTPDKSGGSGIPFINSNPAVPLPTGEIDSATIRPLSTSGHHRPVYSVSPFISIVKYILHFIILDLVYYNKNRQNIKILASCKTYVSKS
jgi:hypothetical protein